MKFADILVFSFYLVAILVAGFWFSFRNQSGENRYVAGRSMGWVTIGISVMVTAFSSVNFLAMPSEVFSQGLYVLIAIPFFFITGFPVTKFIIPFFHRLKLVTVYEYLGLRFSSRVRVFSALLFIVWRFAWMAVALFAAGKMLHVISGISLPLIIILAGLSASAYTAMGGIRSVMRTDVIQFFVLFGAICAGLWLAASVNPGGVAGIFKDGFSSGALKPFAPFDPDFFSFNPFIRITFWSGAAGVFIAFSARYGVDQVVVQRYFTAPDASVSIRGFWLNSFLAVSALLLLAFLGLSIKSFSIQTGSFSKGWPAIKQMAHLFSSMPAGFLGLVTAGIGAATMSSVDSGINSCGAVWSIDVKSVSRDNRGFLYSVVFGLMATLIALAFIPLVGNHGSLFSLMNKIINGLGAPLLAVFFAGLFIKRISSAGALFGAIGGTIYSLCSVILIKGLALHYFAFCNFFITLFIMILVSLFLRDKDSFDRFNKWSYRAVMKSSDI